MKTIPKSSLFSFDARYFDKFQFVHRYIQKKQGITTIFKFINNFHHFFTKFSVQFISSTFLFSLTNFSFSSSNPELSNFLRRRWQTVKNIYLCQFKKALENTRTEENEIRAPHSIIFLSPRNRIGTV